MLVVRAMDSVSWPNVLDQKRGGGDTTPEERAAKLQAATEEIHDAVFSASSCSSLVPPVDSE